MKTATTLLCILLFQSACNRPTATPVSDFANGDSVRTAPPMRVLTFNIRYGTAPDGQNAWPRRREQVTRLLRDGDYDLIGLQEALRFQLDEIAVGLPGYTEIGVGRDDGKYGGEYAALLVRRARYDIIEHGRFWLSENPDEPGSIAWDAATTRICTWARLTDRRNGRVLRVYNTHLDYKSQLAREKAVELILLHAAEGLSTEPTIIMGDFNAGENNPALESLLSARIADLGGSPATPSDSPALFTDTFRAVHPKAEIVGTYHSWTGERSGEKIDHIFSTSELRAIDAEILYDRRDGRYPSDHFPVRATLEWIESMEKRAVVNAQS